jgi:hypothetical protein
VPLAADAPQQEADGERDAEDRAEDVFRRPDAGIDQQGAMESLPQAGPGEAGHRQHQHRLHRAVDDPAGGGQGLRELVERQRQQDEQRGQQVERRQGAHILRAPQRVVQQQAVPQAMQAGGGGEHGGGHRCFGRIAPAAQQEPARAQQHARPDQPFEQAGRDEVRADQRREQVTV